MVLSQESLDFRVVTRTKLNLLLDISKFFRRKWLCQLIFNYLEANQTCHVILISGYQLE